MKHSQLIKNENKGKITDIYGNSLNGADKIYEIVKTNLLPPLMVSMMIVGIATTLTLIGGAMGLSLAEGFGVLAFILVLMLILKM